MDALQLTVPIPAHVARDLDILVGLLRVDREKLLAEMLEREVTKEKERLLMELGTLYAQDKIAKADLVEIVGETIASEMELIKQKTRQSWTGAAHYVHRATD